MISEQHKKTLEQIVLGPIGQQLLDYLHEELDKVNDISTPQTWEDVVERKGKAKFILEVLKHTESKSEETLNPEEAVEAEDVIEAEPETDKFEELYKNQKVRAEKAEAERKALEEKLNQAIQSDGKVKEGLGVEDYIDISASLEGLDQREKEKLAREHKLTGKPLSEIRAEEDFQLWQSAYKAKVAKEKKALHPNGTQPDSERPKSMTERLSTASLEEKEKMLREAGLYKSPRPRADRTHIGDQGLR